jgi:ABC-2 type transport system permease protein
MIAILGKELRVFFGSLIGYFVIGLFLVVVGLFMWVFTETSVLNYPYASLEQLFTIGPLLFMFLIPALTMRSFAEENQNGTLELLYAKPIGLNSIIIGKYLASLMLLVFALIPTFLYVYSLQNLTLNGEILDYGAIQGSYLGLFFCGAAFVSIGIFASSLVSNQILAFLVGAFLCFFFFMGWDYLSALPWFIGGLDLFMQKLGLNYHYNSLSKGILEFKSLFYFISVVLVFLILAKRSLLWNRK